MRGRNAEESGFQREENAHRQLRPQIIHIWYFCLAIILKRELMTYTGFGADVLDEGEDEDEPANTKSAKSPLPIANKAFVPGAPHDDIICHQS